MIISLLLVIAIVVVGCVDYKAYEEPAAQPVASDTDLVDEIAQIERELAEEAANPTNTESMEQPEVTEVPVEEPAVEEEIVADLAEPTPGVIDVRVKENELLRLNTLITDPDGDPVTATFTQPVNNQGEWKTNYGDAGEYLVTLTATDGKLTTAQKIRVIVERVNVAPAISNVRDLSVLEGQVVNFEPTVTDANGDALTVTVSEPLKSGSFVTDHTSAGKYTVKVTASDGEMESVETFTLTIGDVNVKPEIVGVTDLVVSEGEEVRISPEVTDLDGDVTQVTISEPVGNDGVWMPTYKDHGEYFVTVTADDGKDRVTKRIRLLVEDVNKAPEIVDVSLAGN